MRAKLFLTMKRSRYILLLVSFLCCISSLMALEIPANEIIDSLCHVLKKTTTPGEQFDVLRDLAFVTKGTPAEEKYLKELLQLARKADSAAVYSGGAIALAYYYCNTNQLDSLKAMASRAADMKNPDEELLFQIRYCISRYYIGNEEYEIAMNEAVGLLREAESRGYEKGIVACNENIGLIYLMIGSYKEAVLPLEKGMTLLKKSGNTPVKEIQIMPYLLYSYLQVGELKKMGETLAHYQALLEQGVMSPKGLKSEQNLEAINYCVLYSYYLDYYVETKMKSQADNMARKVTARMEELYNPWCASIYYYAMARYYCFLEEYPLALEYINKTLEVDYGLEALEWKTKILVDVGKPDEALAVYGEAVKYAGKQNIKAYTRQIDQLRVWHNLIEKEKQAQLFQNRNIEIKHKHKLLIGFSIFVGVLLVLLVGVVRYALKIGKLKDALEQEQRSLKESTEYLLVAKEKAEKTDQMKTAFVANVSHEIRTPLNAIVGFSALLSDVSEEEETEFIDIINTNTELLLKLVNDVLDLSKLESDNFVLDIQAVDLRNCCQEALSAITHKVQPGVKLTLDPSDEIQVLHTDPSRLLQLLVNLLINAANATQEGEIKLAYRLEPETRQLLFTVTDTGCGIPQEKQQAVFNRFEKVDDFKQGVGLGLPICSEIARRMGGSVSIDPHYTTGARLIVKLTLSEQIL